MKGDFSRFTFDNSKGYIGLLIQQGHLLLDSDWNEQNSIWIENFRQLSLNVLGEFAVPLAPQEGINDNSGAFTVSKFSVESGGVIDFKIGGGNAYVHGFPVTAARNLTYLSQPDYPEPLSPGIDTDILVFVEVWMRAVNYIDDNFIKDPALGGHDSCLRSKVVCQVKAVSCPDIGTVDEACAFIDDTFPRNSLKLTIKIDQSGRQIPLTFGEVDVTGGYSIPNLHLRVEQHTGLVSNGAIEEGIKWSDENCATVTPILNTVDSDKLLVEEPGAVTASFFEEGDTVEICNLVTELHRVGSQMAAIIRISEENKGYMITLDRPFHPLLTRSKPAVKSGISLSPRLRRWSGFIPSVLPEKPVNMGKGIKAIFHFPKKKIEYTPGDYWTFAIRDRDYNNKFSPAKSDPDGIKVYRYPLAIVKKTGKGKFDKIIDCRKFLRPLAS